MVPVLYSPAYIGGRTAAEYWDLTEQIFRDIVVMTGRPVRGKTQQRHGADFSLKHIREDMIFGTKTVWRGSTPVAISDVHRTIIDMLDDTQLGAGIQHVSDCLAAYLEREDSNVDKLLAYAERLGNGAVFNGLGLLAERGDRDAPDLIAACRQRLSQRQCQTRPASSVPSHYLPMAPPCA